MGQLIDDPGLTPSLTAPRGFATIPGTDEELHPTPPPKPVPEEDFATEAAPFIPSLVHPAPGFEAALRSSNSIVSAIAKYQDTYGVSNDLTDPNYSPWQDVVGTKYEPYWKNTFSYSNNANYTTALKRSIDRQQRDAATVAAGGVPGMIAGMVAGSVDPTLLIPGGGEVALAGKGVWSIGRGALAGARAAAVGLTAQELALHASQDIRTPEESVLNVGSGIVLGAVLGGGLSALLSPEQHIASQAGLEAIEKMHVPPEFTAMGAASTYKPTLDDLTIEGAAARNIARATAMSPNSRGNFYESPLARQTMQELSDAAPVQQMHGQGLTLGQDVTNSIRVSLAETLDRAIMEHQGIFQEAKKTYGMSSDNFDNAVGIAMRNNDIGDNPAVTRAAEMWRSTVTDPLLKQAIDLGILPEDVSISEAPSYFSRDWNRDKLVALTPDVISRFADYFDETLRTQYAKQLERFHNRQGDLNEEIANLKLGPEERVKKLADIQAQRQALEQQMAPSADIADQVRNLREQARKAKEEGNTEAAQAFLNHAEELKASGGEDFQTFKKEEARLKKTERQVNLGYGGMQSKADAISQKLTDLTHQNFRAMQRLVARGQKLSTELRKLDPAKALQKISDLRSDFYGLIQRAGERKDALAAQVEKLRADEDKKVQSALAEAGLNKEKLNKKEAAKAAKIEKEVRAENTAITDRLRKGIEEEGRRNARLQAISDRLQAAEAIDRDADLHELRLAVDEMTQEISNRSLGRGEKAADLLERLSKVDPAKVDERIAEIEQLKKDMERKFLDQWEVKRGGEIDFKHPEKVPNFRPHAEDLAREMHQRLTGQDYGSNLIDPEFSRPIAFGPLKGRQFHIPDAKVEDLLNSNVQQVMAKTARRMSAQIELTRKFGDINLGKRIEEISREYLTLEEHATSEAERDKLAADHRAAIRDIIAVRDMHLGTYMAKENASTPGRVSRALRNVNFILRMGGPSLPHISNIYASALYHGPGRFFADGMGTLLKGMDAIKPMTKEARYAVGLEGITHHQLLTLTALGDPYAKGTRFERLLDNMTKVGSKWNGLNMMIDAQKNISSWVNQARLNDALLNGGDEKWLAYSGMTKAQQSTAAKFLKQFGTEEDGHFVANTDRWIEEGGPAGWEAARAYRVAISKNVNNDIVTRAPGDLPLIAQTPLGSLFFQFRTFQLIAHQRMLLRVLQLPVARATSGIMGLMGVGMLAAAVKALRSGKDGCERFKTSAQNPGYLAAEGLDNAAFFTLPTEIGNDVERVSGSAGYPVNPTKLPLSLAGRLIKPDAPIAANTQQGELSNDWTSIFGPSANLGADIIHGVGGSVVAYSHGQAPTKREVHAAQRLVPYSSYLGMRELLQATSGDSPYASQ